MNVKENFMKWENLGVALITGASSGIGAEFARQLAAQGFDLVLVARRKNRLETLSKELEEKFSVNAELFVADLSNIDDNENVVAKILEIDNLDVLINNAGFGITNTFLQIDLKRHIDMINVHFTSTVMFCHAALPGMIKRKKGVIINTSSTAAIHRSPMSVMYTTTKSAVTVFSELIKEKIKRTGVYIQSLCPGFTYSEFHDTESMQGFQRDWFPKENWMNAEDVVSLSLEAVKNGEVIFIPGDLNMQYTKTLRRKSMDNYLNAKIL